MTTMTIITLIALGMITGATTVVVIACCVAGSRYERDLERWKNEE